MVRLSKCADEADDKQKEFVKVYIGVDTRHCRPNASRKTRQSGRAPYTGPPPVLKISTENCQGNNEAMFYSRSVNKFLPLSGSGLTATKRLPPDPTHYRSSLIQLTTLLPVNPPIHRTQHDLQNSITRQIPPAYSPERHRVYNIA